MKTIETIILRNLITNEDYSKKVLPFLLDEYFTAPEERSLFQQIKNFTIKYNALPNVEALEVEIKNTPDLSDDQVKTALTTLQSFRDSEEKENQGWLIDSTETFCQDKAIYLALMKSIEITKGTHHSLSKSAIPDLMAKAVGMTFDPNVGHDYMELFQERYEYYHKVEDRITFDIEYFNRITKGGLPKKTLNVIMAGVGVGKSLTMCHMAASFLVQGKNVLYITLELAEEEVARRIDANLMNLTMDDLMALSMDMYMKRAQMVKTKAQGKLVVKEYPTATASSIHFKALLNELLLKKNFTPDVIIIDYLNICASARLKQGANVNSYSYIKAIAEELRGLAVEFAVPIITATQTTRSGSINSDVGMEDVSESFGLPATADFMVAIINSPELQDLNQIQIKQLKNRYRDVSLDRKFVIGIDRAKMRLYDVDQSAQENISDSGQEEPEHRNKFSGLKV